MSKNVNKKLSYRLENMASDSCYPLIILSVIWLFTRDSCSGRYCWERVLATAILSVRPSVCHDPVRIQGQVRQRLPVFTKW